MLEKKILFHSNLYIDPKRIKQFIKYYQEILSNGAVIYQYQASTSSTITSQVIWYNKLILVDKRSFYNTSLANKGINYVG